MAITKISRNLLNTGVADSSDATAITIDSSENVGIGDTSPSAKLEVSGSSNSTYLIAGGDDATNLRGLKFTSSASTSFNGAIHTINAPSVQGELAFATNNTERARVISSGITFNGDTAAANALYDYEEGTWTPTIIGSSGASGQAYQVQNGVYIRVGSWVHLTFDVWITTVGTLSGVYILLHGHGFTFKSSNLGGACITGYNANIGNMTDYPVTGYINGANIYLMKASNGYMTVAGNNVVSGSRIIGSVTGTV